MVVVVHLDATCVTFINVQRVNCTCFWCPVSSVPKSLLAHVGSDLIALEHQLSCHERYPGTSCAILDFIRGTWYLLSAAFHQGKSTSVSSLRS
jgi:hypothetical protein